MNSRFFEPSLFQILQLPRQPRGDAYEVILRVIWGEKFQGKPNMALNLW